MNSTRFVSIHLCDPGRIQVINLAQVISLDLRVAAGRATANLTDGSQVRGTMRQMWPLLQAIGFTEDARSAVGLEQTEGAASCAADFELMMDVYAMQIEDEEIQQAAYELAEEEAATLALRRQEERSLRGRV